MKKYHIENNTVQETLVIPLYGRKICADHFPDLFEDKEAERICASLDYDFSAKKKMMESPAGLFGALEVAQRHYDLLWEIRDYLKDNPEAAVVNLGCGLDDSFSKADNGYCRGYNIDLPDVIDIRNKILIAKDNEFNIASDLNDYRWMDKIDGSRGAVFFAAGVFYYLKKEEVRRLADTLAQRFPGAVLVFDACNKKGADMMRKTWLKEAGINDVSAYFSIENSDEIKDWSHHFESVSERSYMRGYRDIYKEVNFFHKLMIFFCDHFVRMRIIKIEFRKGER
ncbi:MAG: class I SAM-dependent methyltransferase [Erysipelotrichaceae bacterium]|jgi:O-methyltransferase involved in polyketide biosynthesis|nr:class I SAM-dependent methyltransferase [Erysipelotrichaceae bacterium]